MEYILYAVVFFFGNLFGSFFNVCIYRIPLGESVVSPPSHCPKCGYNIKWYDNIPIISYFILLRGKCRNCSQPINIRYPLIEMLTGVLFVLVFAKYFIAIESLKYIIFVSFLIILTFIDFEHSTLPDVLTIPMTIIGFIFSFFSDITWKESLWGMFAYGIVFLVLFLIGEFIIKKDVMGFGDVKLGVAIGAFVGYTSFLNVYMYYMISFCLGAVVGVALIALKIKSRKELMPFGPYIALAGFLMALYGEYIMDIFYRIIKI